MGIAFTPEQREVIEVRDRNVLVSAAAGSGKTAVLVERIVNRISEKEQPVDIDRLLVVTFTNAAAAEMRERIAVAVAVRLLEEPENEHLQKQATLIHNAQITTIDSFCMFVIRNNFNDIGLDPGFRVADEGELRLLRQDVMEEFLEECYAVGSEEFLRCVEYFSTGNQDKAMENHIMKLYQFAESYPWPEEWLEERRKDYAVHSMEELQETDWMQFVLEQIRLTVSDCLTMLEECLRICGQPDGPWLYADMLEEERKSLHELLLPDTYEEAYEKCRGMSFGRLSAKKDDSVSPEKRKVVQEIRKEVKGLLARLCELYFPAPPETVLEYMMGSEKAVCELASLTLAYRKKLEEKKREENIIDFGDMEHFALSILVRRTENGYEPTRTALDYRAYFKEILIDEYQDSNLVQEYLLKSISGEEDGRGNRFMVGDVKQSIYRFRLARPEIFMEKYDTYSTGNGENRRIDLHKNFRSRKEVIDSVNYIFAQLMGKRLGGVEYDREAFLYPGAVYPQAEGDRCGTELLLVSKDQGDLLPEEKQTKKRTARQREAYAVAKRIKELVGHFPVTDKESGLLRPTCYGDIVVLLRTNTGWDEDFKAVFKEEGIPSHVAAKTGYFAAKEIQTLLQLLRVLDNPRQDIPLFGVMHSCFGGFDDSEIAEVRTKEEDRGKTLYVCLRESADGGNGKAEAFLTFLDYWRERTVYMPIHELLRGIITQTDYLHYVSALPGGEQRRANVNILLEKAAAFEQTSYYGLFHFIRYMEQLEKYDVDYGEANILDENADVVRIMSIHKSKGLEFPVCFVCGLSKRFNRQDTNGKMIADVDLGIGVDFVDPEVRIQGKTLRKNVIGEKLRLDNLGEELRILYVALTRAKEKLILTGVLEKPESKGEMVIRARMRTASSLFYTDIAGANSYMDFVLAALAAHPAFDAWWGNNSEPSEADTLFTLPAVNMAGLPEPPSLVIRTVTEEELVIREIKEQFQAEGARRRLELSDKVTDTDNELLTYMSQKFAYHYEHADLDGLFTKTTVSELKKKGQTEETDFSFRLYEEEAVVPYIPLFMRTEEELGGAGRGSAFHRVMELLDFERYGKNQDSGGEEQTEEEKIREQIEGMIQRGQITEEAAHAVSPAFLVSFMKTKLAGRMAAADTKGCLYREQPFVLGLSAAELKEQFPQEETVLIQGIIDVYFEEDGELVVADYKTDRVKEPQELVEKYEKQLDYYTRALERLTGKRVKEKVIYSFGLHMEIVI